MQWHTIQHQISAFMLDNVKDLTISSTEEVRRYRIHRNQFDWDKVLNISPLCSSHRLRIKSNSVMKTGFLGECVTSRLLLTRLFETLLLPTCHSSKTIFFLYYHCVDDVCGLGSLLPRGLLGSSSGRRALCGKYFISWTILMDHFLHILYMYFTYIINIS